MRGYFTISIILLSAAAGFAEDPLAVVAATDAGRIEFFDASLAPLAGIGVDQRVASISASPDGRKLYVANESTLFSVDLETKKMCQIFSPARFGTPSPDGRYLFTQGKHGIEVFDAATSRPLGTMTAPGAYNLQPSADGRWLLGITNSPKPSLDIFDVKAGGLVRRIPIPSGPATGAWAGERFYIFNYGGAGEGRLWSVKPEDTELTTAKPIPMPDLHGKCKEPALLMLAGAPDQLFLAEAFGFPVDRSAACPGEALGGVYAFRPSSGDGDRLAPWVRVNRMAVTADGRDLYVIEAGRQNEGVAPHLLRIDTRTSRILRTTPLEPGSWTLTLAHIPATLTPRRNVHAAMSCSR